jgi:hypothetical protein
MIPKFIDPGYYAGDDDAIQDDADQGHTIGSLSGAAISAPGTAACGPLHRALSTKESFQHIRAFPRKPGQSVLFTHRVAHWGSARDPDTSLPARIAISFVCSDPAFEAPYLAHSSRWVNDGSGVLERAPPFEVRLLLVCAQLLVYHQRLQLSKPDIVSCYEYCKRRQDELDPAYRQKVFVEFVNAMQDHKDRQAGAASPANLQAESSRTDGRTGDFSERVAYEDNIDDDDDGEEEAMMEEMLDGYNVGQFRDDYDELEAGASGESSDDPKQATGQNGGSESIVMRTSAKPSRPHKKPRRKSHR